MSTLSTRLQEARQRLALKQGELARLLGVSQGTISRWESGDIEPDIAAMMRVAEMAGYDPAQFISTQEVPVSIPRSWGRAVTVDKTISETRWAKEPINEISNHYQFQVPNISEWKTLKLFGLSVDDAESEPEFTRNSVVIASEIINFYADVKYDDAVIVLRKNADGLYNIVVRQVYLRSEKEFVLMPIAGDMVNFDRDVFTISPGGSGLGAKSGSLSPRLLDPAAVIGLVVGVFQVRFPRRLPRNYYEERRRSY